MDPNWIRSNLLVLVAAAVGLLLLTGIAWFLAGIANNSAAGSEVVLPIVILASVVALLIVLGLLTLLLSLLGLGNPGEALGLPGGSIRAVIALMLFVVFAIIAIYLFGVVFKSDHAAGVDLAKQLIVLIGTLVTAVASFYFGSNSTAAATRAALEQVQAQTGSGGPSAKTVTPSALKADDTSQALTITGSNLAKVVRAELVRDNEPSIVVDPATIKAGDSEVKCAVTVTRDAPLGVYSVVVSDDSDNSSRIKDALTIEAAS